MAGDAGGSSNKIDIIISVDTTQVEDANNVVP